MLSETKSGHTSLNKAGMKQQRPLLNWTTRMKQQVLLGIADPGGRTVKGVVLLPLGCCYCEFESFEGMDVSFCVCCVLGR